VTSDERRADVAIAPGVAEIGGQRERELSHGWQVASVAPGGADDPQAAATICEWRAIDRVGPMAAVDDRLDPATLDHFDHWYRCRFPAPERGTGRALLCFDGLATIADVWLNGRHLLRSDSMFLAHACDVSALLRDDNELVLRFRALAPVLRERRPRGRWPVRLVAERSLRFVRTALLGYLPDWCPGAKVAGPWRPIRLVTQNRVAVESATIVPGFERGSARLALRLACRWLDGGTDRATTARAVLHVGTKSAPLRCEAGRDGAFVIGGDWESADVEPWWPHTHGTPARHAVAVEIETADGALRIDLGPIGFRAVGVSGGDLDAFRFEVNGEPVFCRGACWTPVDPAWLHVPAARLREALLQVRDAGMNMLRIPGVFVYESNDFYRLCDELGILVWQDFAFANFDYPAAAEFLDLCRREAGQFLARTAGRCSLAVLCGGSEVQQQAAMMGLPRDTWSHALFDDTLPDVCASDRPDLVYVPSSPCRGDLPFHVRSGPSHYFGVGAYLRPIEDASLAGVRFASECLAFSNVPEDAARGATGSFAGDPLDRLGVPRDVGAEWDFGDVTDHYVESLFGVAARALRLADPARYLSLCRVATGETMAAVQHRWRAQDSQCNGALVWLLRDLRPGAGWGLVDATGAPKAPWYFLARAWSPLAAWIVDEGVNGLRLHLANDEPRSCRGSLTIEFFRTDGACVERAEIDVEIGPHSQLSWCVEALLGHFVDASWAYRFGPPGHDAVVARFVENAAAMQSRRAPSAFYFPTGASLDADRDAGLSASAEALADGSWRVTATAERIARWVAVEAPGFRTSDSYFHVAPGASHEFRLVPLAPGAPLQAGLRPLHAHASTPIEVIREGSAQPPGTR
jgi:beta-mannosidase